MVESIIAVVRKMAAGGYGMYVRAKPHRTGSIIPGSDCDENSNPYSVRGIERVAMISGAREDSECLP